VGDLANGRTVRSLAYLLAKYQDVKIYFVSPNVVKMKVIAANSSHAMIPYAGTCILTSSKMLLFFIIG